MSFKPVISRKNFEAVCKAGFADPLKEDDWIIIERDSFDKTWGNEEIAQKVQERLNNKRILITRKGYGKRYY